MDGSTIMALVLGGVILICLFVRHLFTRNSDYWDKRGVTTVNPGYGQLRALADTLMRKKNLLDTDVDRYKMLNERFGGTVDFGVPSLLIKDPELIKQILVKDFDYFVDRRKIKMENEPLFNLMLTALEGQEWKNVRSHMSPTFTTGKIRRMFEHFNSVGRKLVGFVKSKPVGSPGSRDVVVKEAVARYLVDVIGATAFGMDTNSLEDPNSIFYKMSMKTSEFSVLKLFKLFMMLALPWLSKLGFKFGDNEAMPFFEEICRKALKNREQSGEKREDFLQIMIEARKGELKTDESELDAFEKDAQLKGGDVKGKVQFTDDLIVAQSLLFFLAGLETTGSVLCFAVYILALDQDIQNKMYEEVAEVMKGKGGDVDYEGMNKMEYMDKFVSEVLRKYPPGVRLERRVTRPYTIPGTNVTLEKDVLIHISALGMHRDPEYYPDPEKFDPERFSPEEKAKRNPYTYLPFGQGPRNCIGMRFALMEAKVALAYLVYNFKIEPCESTPVPIKLDPTMGARPIVELELRFKERTKIEE